MSNQLSVISEQEGVKDELIAKVAEANQLREEAEVRIQERGNLENQRNEARERFAALKVENESLRKEMDEIKKRIDSLEDAHGVTCPVCGQELSEAHRASTSTTARPARTRSTSALARCNSVAATAWTAAMA